MREIIKNNPIIAIIRNLPADLLIPYVNTIIKGGIHALEIAMNTPDGAEQIKTVKKHFGNEIMVGAGTAITKERINLALDAGAEFFLTPSISDEILAYFRQNNLKVLPGIITPSDVGMCLSYGFNVLKLFPAGDMPMSYVKNLKGPFDNTDYVAVGGVTLDNLSDFFSHGYIGAGIASNLIPEDYILERDWTKAAIHIGKFVEICKSSKIIDRDCKR
ncbi:MAG: bifunctional 4-hydroxy-2-oxoglutarate aldolase/2-dehydro-3-deoxy-phosphogluconate aldolase [Mobilitalea sp.]